MQSTELCTRWRSQLRLEMKALVWERKPWKRHSKEAIKAAYARCADDAHHNARVALGLTSADVEVVDIRGAESTAPADAYGFEEVGEELEVFTGGVGHGDRLTTPHESKVDSATLRVA